MNDALPSVRKKKVFKNVQNRLITVAVGVLFSYSLFLIAIAFLPQLREYFSAGLTPNRQAALEGQFVSLFLLILFSLAASVLMVLLFTHKYFSPLFQIEDKIIKLLEKNLTTRLGIEDNPDFRELASEFNTFVEEIERLVLILRLEQEEISMILMKARKEAHLKSTRDILDRISKHNEKIIEHLLSYRVLGDR